MSQAVLGQTTPEVVTVQGIGLITGLPVIVRLQKARPGEGIRFVVNGTVIAARAQAVVHSENGITLAAPAGTNADKPQTLSIVEHFLGAVSLLGLSDLLVTVDGAPELPLLDGSAAEWVQALQPFLSPVQPGNGAPASLRLKQAVVYEASPGKALPKQASIMALPSDRLRITYGLGLEHQLTENRFVCWDSAVDSPELLLRARTFGLVRDLPAIHAKGLAKGVSVDNTLGLNDDGSTTSPLRFENEPLYHKCLDLVGDCFLSGLPLLRVKTHIIALYAGHASHLAFACQLREYLLPEEGNASLF